MFKNNVKLLLEAYINANYVGSIINKRSTIGYCIFFGDNLITWRRKKQNVISRSSVKSEFQVMAQGVCKLLWIKRTLKYIKIKWKFLYVDSLTIDQPRYHSQSDTIGPDQKYWGWQIFYQRKVWQ